MKVLAVAVLLAIAGSRLESQQQRAIVITKGVPCAPDPLSPGGNLMVQLNDTQCLPIIVIAADGKQSFAQLDTTGITYSPSGAKLVGVVVP